MSSDHTPASNPGDPLSRLLELSRLWSSRPRWEELQYALGLTTRDATQVVRGREELSEFIARGDLSELVPIQRRLLENDESMLAGSRRQLLRWLGELCELQNLTAEHAPHLLGHVPDVELFTGRIDRPPPSDAACEGYAARVRALLGGLLVERRQRSGTAVVTPTGVPALRATLAGLLAACEAEPIRLTRLQTAIRAVWAVFGGVSDDQALVELVRGSGALSAPARDAVASVVYRMARLSYGIVWDDIPDGMAETEYHDWVRKHEPDKTPVREFRQELRAALDAIPTDCPVTAGDGTPARGQPDGPEGGRWVHWRGKRHDVPTGNVYNLISHFWSRDCVPYDELNDHVFQDPVEPQTVRSNLSKTNKVLVRIGIPWRLEADSVARVARKSAAG